MVIDTLARTPYSEIGKTFTSATHRVRLPPKVPKRLTIPLPQPKLTVAPGKFSLLTYNLLADLYSNVSCLPLLHFPVTVPLLSAVGPGPCVASQYLGCRGRCSTASSGCSTGATGGRTCWQSWSATMPTSSVCR